MITFRFLLRIALVFVVVTIILFYYFNVNGNDFNLSERIIEETSKLSGIKQQEPVDVVERKGDEKEVKSEESDEEDEDEHNGTVNKLGPDVDAQQSKWLNNFNIVQYSIQAVMDEHRELVVEGLVFVLNRHDLEEFSEEFVCLIRIDDKTLEMSATQVYNISKPLKKVVCRQKESLDMASDKIIQAAIFYKSKKGSSGLHFSFQSVRVAVVSTNKRKEVAHCAYLTSKNLESEARIDNWLKIQKSLGVHKMRVYFYSNGTLSDKLKESFKDFAEFVNLSLEEEVCEGREEKQKQCISNYDLISRLHSQHEQLSLNDCYTKFRHEYELVSSFGIDDILLPRFKKELNKLQVRETCPGKAAVCEVFSVIPAHGLYTYADTLIKELGASSSLQFKRLAYLKTDDSFLQKLSKASESVEYAHGLKIAFKPDGELNSKKFSQAYNFTKCFLSNNSNGETNSYNRFVSFNTDLSPLNAIFNTKNTEAPNVNNGDSPKGEVKLDSGHSIYFGDLPPANFENSTASMSQLDFDLDFFLLLLKNSNSVTC